jgi:hypothetical protein
LTLFPHISRTAATGKHRDHAERQHDCGSDQKEKSVANEELIARPKVERPPGGARDCLRTRNIAAPCDVCGARPELVHTPMRGRGALCAAHCGNWPAAPEPEGGAR